MPKPLWAPWRLEYVTHADEQPGCVFCAEAAGEVEDTLVVGRGERLRAAQLQREQHQALLNAIVEIALDAAARLIRGGDQPGA